MKSTEILLKLRARLTAAGYRVNLGRFVDPKQRGQLPCVGISYGQEGEVTTGGNPTRKQLTLVAQYACHTNNPDALLELMAEAVTLEAALIQPDLCSGVDRLDGLASENAHGKTVTFIDGTHSDLGIVEIQLRISYIP